MNKSQDRHLAEPEEKPEFEQDLFVIFYSMADVSRNSTPCAPFQWEG